MKKNIALIIVFSFITFSIFSRLCFAYRSIEFNGVDRRDVIREDTLREKARFGDYEVRIYRDWDVGTDGVVQILKGGEIVFEEQGHEYSIEKNGEDQASNDSPGLGEDITDDGEPNLIISHWSGGAHCCYDFYVFSIGDEFRFIDKLDGEHGSGSFEDINDDGIYEFITNDWAFAYWHECFAGSPAPQVVLTYKNGRYQLAYDLMKNPPRSDDEYYEAAGEYEKLTTDRCSDTSGIAPWQKNGECITSPVWEQLLTLIYTGHADEAWGFLDRIWKGDEPTKQAFIDDFKRQLALSYYAEGLPVDLDGYRPDIDDESDKQEIRVMNYFNTMLELIESQEKSDPVPKLPGIDTMGEDSLMRAIRGWSGQ